MTTYNMDNIRVAVRMRPLIQRELDNKEVVYWKYESPNTVYQNNSPSVAFTFDRVFGNQEENETIYTEFCSDIVKSVIDGFNGTIFAYGQTSSGKTFTMLGDNSKKTHGIIHYAISDIFNLMQNMPEREFLLRVSYMEIYNETVRDLLSDENENLKLGEENGQIKVVGLKEYLVQKPDQILKYMKDGERRRRTGDTLMNEKSSRSHSIFRMIIESGLRGVEEGAVNVSQFNLIDLAGSERARQTGATGARLKESININQSLLGLSRVIRQLSENENQFISYRDSKLTRILQNSLGGNALTAIICTITSACLEETISTLKFAEKAKRIKNKPQVNEVLNEQALLKQYANKIKKLTAELEATKEEKSQENKNLQEKIKYLTKQFVFQMNPAHKTKNVRRETWGGTLDAARLRMQFAPKKSFVPVPIEDTLSDLTSFDRNHPKSRPRSLENHFPPLKSKSCSTQSSFGSRNLSILEEECEDFNLLDGDDIFSNSHHQQSKKSFTKRTSTLRFTNATVQTIESECVSCEANSEKMKFMSDQILSLKKELADLQEFTTLEKQFMTEHALSPNDCMDANIDEKKEIKERSFSEVVNEKNADFPSEQALKNKISILERDLEAHQKTIYDYKHDLELKIKLLTEESTARQNLEGKVVALQKDMETYLKTISDYKYDLDLKEKQITILNDKVTIQKQMIDTFQCELALKANKSDTNEKEIQTNISNYNIPSFMDQSCQVTYIEDISLIGINSRNTSQLQLGEEDMRNLSFNCDKSINENEIFVNQCPEKLLQQNLQSVIVEESLKENPVELLNHFEATLKDLTELKLFTLEFMKRDMKKEYLGDIESLDQNVNAVLTDRIKIEITALKEMLMKIDFYLQDRADSAEYFNNFLEDKLIEMSSLEDKLKEKESEFRILGENLINMENDLKELIQKVKSLGSSEENSELEDNLIIHSDDKHVECINNMQNIIFAINNHINKKTSSINELSLKLNEAQNKLKILQEDQNIFKLTKSIQTVEDQEYLELSQKLKEVEASKKETDDEINNFKLKLDLMTKEKESFKQELEDKIAFYNKKLEVMKKNFDSEKEEWAAKTTECVLIVEEKYDQMFIDQENRYFDEINQIKQSHKLELIQKKNEHWEQCQIKRDELEEEHQKRIQEIKDKLITEIEERYKEKEELENEIRILKKEINHFRDYTNHIKDKYKQLATEFRRQKEELKTLEKHQDVQEKVTEKSIKTKNTQTDPLQLSDIEAIHEKACADNVKEAEILCRRIENELEAKKAKIMSLNTNNACMVREIMALKKELNQKGLLLLNCKCRVFSKMTESQNYKKKESIEKIESTNYKAEKETESIDLKLNSEAILQLDIVKDAIKEAKEEAKEEVRAALNSGNGPATEMKCHYLQAKLNKTNKELAMLKKEMDKFKDHPLKKNLNSLFPSEASENDLPDRDLTTYKTNPVPPICNELAPKLKPKKILKERNKKYEGPVTALQEGIKKQNLNYENIEHAAIRNPNIEEAKINQHAERNDKIKETRQEIERFAGEPECKQQ